mgnify:CR=1 FL=1
MRNYRHSLKGVSGFRKLLLLLLISVSARAADTLQISYSQSFANATTYCPGESQWDEWATLRDSMDVNAMNFVKVVVSSDLDSTGYTLEGSSNVNAIVEALNTGVDTLINDGNYQWLVKSECFDTGSSSCVGDSMGMSLEIYSLALTASGCDCNALAAVRPEIGNSNWGGVSTDTTVCGSATQTMSVVFGYFDILDPVAVCNDDTVYLDGFGMAQVDPFVIGAGSYDLHSGVATIELDSTSFDCDQTGPHSLALTVTDSAGNTDVCMATVTVLDTIMPTLTCRDTTIYLNTSGYITINTDAVLLEIFDNCTAAPAVTLSADSFTVADLGTNPVLVIATDPSGNMEACTASVTVVDTIAPVAVCQPFTLFLDGASMATLVPDSLDGGSTDNSGGTLLFTADITSFDCANEGVNTVTMYVTDLGGNIDSCTATVTVVDTLAPTSIPVDTLVVYLDANGDFTIIADSANNGSTDNCDSIAFSLVNDLVDCTDAGDSPIGAELIATDASGNADTTSFIVSVLDTIGPDLGLVDSLTVYLDTNGVYTVMDSEYSTVTEACGLDSVSPNMIMVDCDDLGWDTIVFTAVDIYSNTTVDSFALNVVDTIIPTVSTVPSITVYLDSMGVSPIDTTGIVTGSWDNCSVDSFMFSLDSVNCGDFPSVNLVVNSVDNSGNVSNDAIVTVNVEDTIVPIASTFDTIVIYADGSGMYTFDFDADLDNMSWDNCDFATIITPSTLDCDSIGVFTTITIEVFDAAANADTTTTVVMIVDTLAPVVVANDNTIALDASGMAVVDSTYIVDFLITSMDDNCDPFPAVINIDPTSFDCDDFGINPVSFSFQDIYGNTSFDTVNVDVIDTLVPVAMAQNSTIYLDASGIAVVNVMAVDNGSTDNCDLVYTTDRDTFYCDEEGLNLIRLYVTDIAGNVDSADAFIYVYDTISPTLDVQDITVELDANGVVSIIADQIDVNSFDNCDDQLNLVLDIASFDCSNIGANSVMITAFDENGQSSSQTVTVTVEDNVVPVVVTQSISVNLDSMGNASITAAMLDNGSTDNCGIDTLYLDVYDFTCANVGDNAIYLTAEDAQGNAHSAVAIVTVVDVVAPEVMTQDITVQLDAAGEATITSAMIDNGSTDTCGLTLSLDVTTFNCSNLGANVVTLTGVDASGNTTSATATVTVEDNVAPVALAQNLTVELDANGQAVVTANMIDNGSYDNCSLVITQFSTTYTCADLGNHIVILVVNDADNNVSTATATVMVVDNVVPVAVAQALTIQLDANGDATIAAASDLDGGSSDNCTDAVDLTFAVSQMSFDETNLGVNNVDFMVTDQQGNMTTINGVVIVEDNIAPESLGTTNDIIAFTDSGSCSSAVTYDEATFTDNAGDANVVVTYSIGNGSVFGLGTTVVTATGTDASGNSVSETFNVTVEDNIAPIVVSIPTVFSEVFDTPNCQANVTWQAPVAVDNCSGVTYTSSHNSGDMFAVGTTTVTYTATDDANNATVFTFDVVVVDPVAPTFSSTMPDVVVNANASCEATASWFSPLPLVSDNCGGVTVSTDFNSGDVFPLGVTVVTVTATDDAGNVGTTSFTVTVVDQTSPSLAASTQDIIVELTDCDAATAVDYVAPAFADNCSFTVVQIAGLPSGSVFPEGLTVNTFEATDAAGNTTTYSFTVNVNYTESTAPTLSAVPVLCFDGGNYPLPTMDGAVTYDYWAVNNGNMFWPGGATGVHTLTYTYTDPVTTCVSTGTIDVTVVAAAENVEITQIGSDLLTVTGSYDSYTWLREQQVIAGATSAQLTITAGGMYECMVTNAFGCISYSNAIVIGESDLNPLGQEELELGEVSIVPNPNSGQFSINLDNKFSGNLSVDVYDLRGAKVSTINFEDVSASKVDVDLTDLSAAMYQLVIRHEEYITRAKIVITK